MAHMYGINKVAGSTTSWHPLRSFKNILGEYLLRVTTSGVAKHYNGSVDASNDPITVGLTKRVIIQNTHASQSLSVSFDGGSKYFTLAAGKSLDIDVETVQIDVLGSGVGTTYEILVLE